MIEAQKMKRSGAANSPSPLIANGKRASSTNAKRRRFNSVAIASATHSNTKALRRRLLVNGVGKRKTRRLSGSMLSDKLVGTWTTLPKSSDIRLTRHAKSKIIVTTNNVNAIPTRRNRRVIGKMRNDASVLTTKRKKTDGVRTTSVDKISRDIPINSDNRTSNDGAMMTSVVAMKTTADEILDIKLGWPGQARNRTHHLSVDVI